MDAPSAEYIANLQRRLQAACQKASVAPVVGLDTVRSMDLATRIEMPGAEAAAGARSPVAASEMRVPSQLTRCDGVVRSATASATLMPRSSSPADEGAGCACDDGMIKRFCSVSATSLSNSTSARQAPNQSGSLDVGRAGRMDDVAKDVLRLRLLKQQHDELGAQLTRARAQTKRLSPQNVLQLHSYLERNLCDPRLAAHVQEALIRLLECMCAVTGIEMTTLTPESLLSCCRKLLRDPHSFTNRLINMQPLSTEEAQGLAPFLLVETEYQRTADKDVNSCYDALHGWLSAFYFFSAVSDQVTQVAMDLAQQEALLRRLGSQCEEPKRRGGLGQGWPSMSAPAVEPEERPAQDKLALSPKAQVHSRRSTTHVHSVGVGTKARPTAGSPSLRSSPTPRSGVSKNTAGSTGTAMGNTGVSRRPSATPSDPGVGSRGSGDDVSGITRMHSDKALSQVLRAKKKDVRSPSGSQSPLRGNTSTGAFGSGGGGASPSNTRGVGALSQARLSRQSAGSLPSVPERYSSVPEMPATLLESIHRRSSAPIAKKESDPHALRWPANHPARIA